MKNKKDTFELLDMQIPELANRTRLYSLPPANIGTADVESLTGYISRLAQAHSISPIVLLKNSVSDLKELPKSILQNSLSSTFSRSINGFGKNTKIIVQILKEATHQENIEFLSLLFWKRRLSNHKLLKKNLAWCPLCFDEQIKKGVVYEKLLWTIYEIKACQIHDLPLIEKCPHCHKKLNVLAGKSRPGYCSKCLTWLGTNLIKLDEFRKFNNKEEKKKELWKANKMGELLAKFPFLAVGNNSTFAENLTEIIENNAYGSINDFAFLTGMWHISIRRLIKNEVLPTVEMICKICMPFDISFVELFILNDEVSEKTKILPNDIKKPVSKDEIIICLKCFLSDIYPPISANEVSRRTGWTTTRLQRNYPDEYQQIVKNYLEYHNKKIPKLSDKKVEAILRKALKKKSPPSLQSIFRDMGCRNTGYRYYKKFPKLCGEISKRYKDANRKEFDVEKAKRVMNIALKEHPPPSFSEIARRIKCSRSTLDNKFPQLSKYLHQRYKSYLEKYRNENFKELCNAVRNALAQISERKEEASMNKVKKLLPRKWNDKKFKKAYHLISKEMKENL